MMNKTENSYQPTTSEKAKLEEEIDLRQVGRSFLRHIRLIIAFGGVGFIYSLNSALQAKHIWQGQFQIVLESRQQGGSEGRLLQMISMNPLLSSVVGQSGGSGTTYLQTEIKILKSPSVLKPIFDYVKSEKAKDGIDTSKMKYTSWAGNLSIKLEKGTSVLNISYQDTNKNLILPIMNMISTTYQEYSGRDRERGLTQGISYLEKQVEIMSKKTNESLTAAQKFALENGLGVQDGFPIPQLVIPSATQAVSPNSSQITAERGVPRGVVQEQNSRYARLFSNLQSLEGELIARSTLLKPNAKSIKALKLQINSLKEALGRPTEELLKHRKLVRTAVRNETTLSALETQLQALRLDKAKQTNPWELISTPTLGDTPVAPNKKRMVAYGLLVGLAVGAGISLIIDRLSGLIFNLEEIKSLLPFKVIENLPSKSTDSWEMALMLLAQGPLNGNKSGDIALIPVGKIPDNQLKAFVDTLVKALNGRNLVITTDLLESKNCSTQILLASPGTATRDQMSQLTQRLILQASPVAGLVLLDPELKL